MICSGDLEAIAYAVRGRMSPDRSGDVKFP